MDKNQQPRYTDHPVSSEGSLYVACQHVGRVVPVVGDAGQACVDRQQNQEELHRRPQQPSSTPRQPGLQVKLHHKNKTVLINATVQPSSQPLQVYVTIN